MKRIFISYSREDETFARLLALELDRFKADVWIDVEKIIAGMIWETAIQDGLDSSDAMLVIISPDSVNSVEVEKEWQQFIRTKKLVIPVLWRSVEKIPKELANFQYVNFSSQSYKIARDILVTTLKSHEVIRIGTGLKKREELPTIDDIALHAKEISVLSVSSGSLADEGHYKGLLDEKILKNKCHVKLLIVKGDEALQHWAKCSNQTFEKTQLDLERILNTINRILSIQSAVGKFEVRYSDFHLTFNLFGVNINADDNTGLILVGYYAYGKIRGRERPHLLFSKRDDPEWFEFYREQFNNAWEIGTPYDSAIRAADAQSRSQPDQSLPT
jgi:hypothetical protein